MSTQNIEQDFKTKVCDQISLYAEGSHRYRVFTPFTFDDGDCLAIVLKLVDSEWQLSDEGHTLMHLSYKIDEKDLNKGTRQKIISNTLDGFSIQNKGGELVKRITDSDYGNCLFDFTQALIKISDVTYLSRERVRSTFIEDFEGLIKSAVPADRVKFHWHDKNQDPKGNYLVDCKVNGMADPLFIFALNNEDRVRDATICLHQYENWGFSFRSIGIFESQEEVSRKVLARFSDICGKQFSSLDGNKDRISTYLQKAIAS
jgi:hypothetical protein